MSSWVRALCYGYEAAFILAAIVVLSIQGCSGSRLEVGKCYLYAGQGNAEREWKVTAIGKRSALLKAANGYGGREAVNVPTSSFPRAIEVDCSEELDKKAVTRCDDACRLVNLPLKREEIDNSGYMTLCACGG